MDVADHVSHSQCRRDRRAAEDDKAFIGIIRQPEGTDPWSITLTVNGKPVEFKNDTGSDVTIDPMSVLGAFLITPPTP
jgi:hypothetical protein